MFMPEKSKRIPYASYKMRGAIYLLLPLTLFFWALYIWLLVEGESPSPPIVPISLTICSVACFIEFRRVKALEVEGELDKEK